VHFHLGILACSSQSLDGTWQQDESEEGEKKLWKQLEK
jgi:hypothetical protein